MLGLVVAIVIGIIIGLARRGSFARLQGVRLEKTAILYAAVLAQIVSAVAERSAGRWPAFALIVTAYAGVCAFAVANRHLIGMPLIALGALGNFIVIAVNGGMPVSRRALALAGLGNPFEGRAKALLRGAHHLMAPQSRVTFLADVIPLRVGATVISVGDILLWAGIVLLLQHLLVGPRGRHRRDARTPN
ncbi:MAG: DUF5317 domain-containing protein [Actinomycetota bacterium]|nr:DUF5317 domain-containing protein [Actinomycetota bacterium]